MKITITGRIPSKKNGAIALYRGGKIIHIPSNKYREWHKNVEDQMWGKIPKKPIELANIEITIFAPDKRASDLTNKAESVMDFLVDMKVLADDNWFVCPNVNLKFGGVDKENPRAEIEIK